MRFVYAPDVCIHVCVSIYTYIYVYIYEKNVYQPAGWEYSLSLRWRGSICHLTNLRPAYKKKLNYQIPLTKSYFFFNLFYCLLFFCPKGNFWSARCQTCLLLFFSPFFLSLFIWFRLLIINYFFPPISLPLFVRSRFSYIVYFFVYIM